MKKSFVFLAALALCALVLTPRDAQALPPNVEASVVSVLPVWPGAPQGGTPDATGAAPEGSGVAMAPDIIATAWHVIEPAERIDVRLSDGRILPARLVAADPLTDIALLRISEQLTPLDLSYQTDLAQPVCAIGNAFGLGLSVSCGVVSASGVSNAGFNAVEDFIQTDAAINPGMSGGALLDADGRLVGLVSAIFASASDTNTGVSFAVSAALLTRVTDALLDDGKVRLPDPGWRLAAPDRATLARVAAPVVAQLVPGGPAAASGLQLGDLVVELNGRRVMTPRDSTSALALAPQGAPAVPIVIDRAGTRLALTLPLTGSTPSSHPAAPTPDCPYPAPVCAMRQAVFPVSSFDPVGSATRIAPDLLVTNRHVMGDRLDAIVHTPDGPRDARLVPSSYAGDLVLLQVAGLPQDAQLATMTGAPGDGPFFAIGADIAREVIRVFEPGDLIAPPATDARFGRLHVSARMQPGVSGGALVDDKGNLQGISVGGGEGRFEAIPIADVDALLALRQDANAARVTRRLGQAFVACEDALQDGSPDAIARSCAEADNPGQLLEAGRVLSQAGAFDAAADLTAQALDQVPNSLNTRITHLVVLQLGARFADMVPHARRVIEMAPDDPRVLRFAIQSGVWGGDPQLAEDGYSLLLAADPAQAQAARRFLESAPPAPTRR